MRHPLLTAGAVACALCALIAAVAADSGWYVGVSMSIRFIDDSETRSNV